MLKALPRMHGSKTHLQLCAHALHEPLGQVFSAGVHHLGLDGAALGRPACGKGSSLPSLQKGN